MGNPPLTRALLSGVRPIYLSSWYQCQPGLPPDCWVGPPFSSDEFLASRALLSGVRPICLSSQSAGKFYMLKFVLSGRFEDIVCKLDNILCFCVKENKINCKRTKYCYVH
jgi:hypothetical protein